MQFDQLLLIIIEGLIFAFFAYSIYLSFEWLKFPDLTPDGSFVIGGCVYIKMVNLGIRPLLAILISFISGALCGVSTGILNRYIKIPAVISGIIMSTALYSVSWNILGKPNEFLDNTNTLVGNYSGSAYNFILFLYVIAIFIMVTFILHILSNTIWGIKIKSIGENPILSKSFTKNETAYYLFLLGLSNGIVSVSGSLFLQRSFSADVNMGVSQTIVGLTAMLIGLILKGNTKKTYLTLIYIGFGAIIYKTVMFYVLELGLPAEFFKLVSALSLVILFLATRARSLNLLKGLRWN